MAKTVRYASRISLCGWPLLCIARGPDLARKESRGHAKGFIAIGDVATGFIAIGGLASGVIAVGGLAIGLLTVAGVGIGAFVIGGVALAHTAFGGVAVGQYAKGGAAIGTHVVCSKQVDDSAAIWFSRLGLHTRVATQGTKPPADAPVK